MKPLNEDRDARRWAKEFIERFGANRVGGPIVDEGLLISWFANAMMCGEDTYRWRKEKEASQSEAVEQVPQGWKLVPVEPTPEMMSAGRVSLFESSFHDSKADVALETYTAMLAASPSAAEEHQ